MVNHPNRSRVKYHVESSVDGQRWMRDFEPSRTIEEARKRLFEEKAKNGKPCIESVGGLNIDCGIVPYYQYRIVKVTREVVE